jgi:hypothetical protein
MRLTRSVLIAVAPALAADLGVSPTLGAWSQLPKTPSVNLQRSAVVDRLKMVRGVTAVMMATLLLGCASSGRETIVLHRDGLLRITGTFTDIRVETDRGLFGVEIRIVCSREPLYQAAIQIASGTLCSAADLGSEPCFRISNLIVVEAELEQTTAKTPGAASIRFQLSKESGYPGSFEGEIAEHVLTGTFSFESGKTLPVVLKRGPSHWDGPGKS